MPTFDPHITTSGALTDRARNQDVLTKDYYKQRTAEYEDIYNRPEPIRQSEQQSLAAAMSASLSGRHVLELACGTGYWTERLSSAAESIFATDAIDELIQIASHKRYPKPNVQFGTANAFDIKVPSHNYDGGMSNFWLSHVPRQKLVSFLEGFHNVVGPGATIFMADNVYVKGIGGMLINKPNCNDTSQLSKC